MAVRIDAWKPEDDAVLEETVLEHIRDGRAQLDAFQVAAIKLERTPKACGFRWNTVGRFRHADEIKRVREAWSQGHIYPETQRPRTPREPRQAGDRRYAGVRFNPTTHKRLKVYAIINEVSMSDVLDEALVAYLDAHGAPQV